MTEFLCWCLWVWHRCDYWRDTQPENEHPARWDASGWGFCHSLSGEDHGTAGLDDSTQREGGSLVRFCFDRGICPCWWRGKFWDGLEVSSWLLEHGTDSGQVGCCLLSMSTLTWLIDSLLPMSTFDLADCLLFKSTLTWLIGLLGGLYVSCIICMPGGIIVGDSGFCCVPLIRDINWLSAVNFVCLLLVIHVNFDLADCYSCQLWPGRLQDPLSECSFVFTSDKFVSLLLKVSK